MQFTSSPMFEPVLAAVNLVGGPTWTISYRDVGTWGPKDPLKSFAKGPSINSFYHPDKGLLISKCPFGLFNLIKKPRRRSNLNHKLQGRRNLGPQGPIIKFCKGSIHQFFLSPWWRRVDFEVSSWSLQFDQKNLVGGRTWTISYMAVGTWGPKDPL